MLNNSPIQQLLQEEKYAEALPLLQQELQQEATSTTLRALIAQCYYRMGDFHKSADELSAAITIDPAAAQLYSDRGVSYFMLQNRTAALQDFDRAQQLEPQNPYRYSSRAYVKDAFGDTKGAIADYQQAIALDPADAIAYNNLGLVLEKVGYQQEAQQHFAKADALEGRTPATAATANSATEKSLRAPVPAVPQQKQQLSLGYYGRVLREVFTTRKGFREFVQHWLGKRF